MGKPKRIFIISGITFNHVKMFFQTRKLTKGFIRVGHDCLVFNYPNALSQLSPFKGRTFSGLFYKSRVDELMADQIREYKPHIIYVTFAKFLDSNSIQLMRLAAPNAVLIGNDGDPWPKLQSNRLETAKELDILTVTNDDQWRQDYLDAGVPKCVFMPNMCDPDIEHRYDVSEKWKTDILWIGVLKHHADTSTTFRERLVRELSKLRNCTLYGCCGRPKIGGMDCLYAISGARISVNVNAYGPIRKCHSDRLTRYLACGTFAIAKKVPDSEFLFKDGKHLKYFDDIDEFFELAKWYLEHETERKRIADEGMKWMHEQFNCVKMAGYVLELIEKGTYSSPWT